MLYKNNIFSILPEKKAVHVKSGIDPSTNFLLKRAELIATLEECDRTLSLYRLHNGNYAELTKYKGQNLLQSDSLVRIDFWQAAAKFNLNVSIGNRLG